MTLVIAAALLLALSAVLWQEDRRRSRRLALVSQLAPDAGVSSAATSSQTRGRQTTRRQASSSHPDDAAPERLEATGLRSLLSRAELAVSPATFVAAVAALAVGLAAGLAWFLASPLVLPLAAASVPLLAMAWLRSRVARRERAIQERLPEAVDVLARAVRAGQPMDAALREGGERIPGPLGAALRRLVEELAVGVPFERATRAMAARHPDITELRFLSATLILQRETGGNLARVLESLAATLRERIVLRRDVQAATAEGRASALVLTLMPLVFAVGIALLRPDYVAPLFQDPAGRLILVAAGVLEVLGFVAMRWLARVEA